MRIIVSYDGTPNDEDALTLGRMLAAGEGVSLSLAYVRHTREYDPDRESIAQHDAERRLEQGATRLGDPSISRHIVFNRSTPEGLEQLGIAEGAKAIIFGSDYRTPVGRAEPGGSAQQLIEGSSVAVAVAAAGLRADARAEIARIAVPAVDADGAAVETADVLATSLHATVVPAEKDGTFDLIVVSSQSTAPDGRIALSGASRSLLNGMTGSVLALPRGTAVRF
jgi:nucleotide-binding universal stress UspA family protein